MYAYVASGGETLGPMTVRGLPNGLIDHHCYGVMGVDKMRGEIILRNPSGGTDARSVVYAADG